MDDATVDALAEARAAVVGRAAAAASPTPRSPSRETGRRRNTHENGVHETAVSVCGAVASRARLLAAVGECDPKAREWIRSARAAERTDALAAKCEETASSLKRVRPAATAARDAAARLRRRG